jgi:hypothetical protein
MLEKQGCSVEDLTVLHVIKNHTKLEDHEREIVRSLQDRGLVSHNTLYRDGYPEITSAGLTWLEEKA